MIIPQKRTLSIGVLGAGAWGTSLAITLHRQGHSVRLFTRRSEHALQLQREQENRDYLPNVSLKNLAIEGVEAQHFEDLEILIFAFPAKGLELLCKNIQEKVNQLPEITSLISVCKGMLLERLETPLTCLKHFFPKKTLMVLSGPSYALELAQDKATLLVLATDTNTASLSSIREKLCSPTLRIYTSSDAKGVELGGCLKNIYAIGAGICETLPYVGDNGKAGYLTRALTEMIRIGHALGGEKQTFYGLSGLGDLIATSQGHWSKNRKFGKAFAEQRLDTHNPKTVVEGYNATQCLFQICKQRQIYCPLLTGLYQILFEQQSIDSTFTKLMQGPLKEELVTGRGFP